jgi:hypothetical protein
MVSRLCETGDKTVGAEPIANPIEVLKTVYNDMIYLTAIG